MKPQPDFADAYGKRVLVALSGGTDSVALLLLLKDAGVEICVAHVEHGLRGEASLQDAAFCEALCKELNIPFLCIRVGVAAECARTGEGVETVARRLRYAALRDAKAHFRADIIALAHHAEDQAETILMHLLRGSGLEGACGMRRMQGDLCRPLLNVHKSTLREVCASHGITPREDATNAVADNPRNALRLNVFPALETFYPGAVAALNRFGESAACDLDCIDAQARAYLCENATFDPWGIVLRSPRAVHEAVLRRALHILPGMDDTPHDKLLELAHLNGKTRISSRYSAFMGADALYLYLENSPHFTPQMPTLDGRTALPGVGALIAEPVADPVPSHDPLSQVLDADTLRGCVVRFREDGDRIRPLGGGDKLLSDVFTDKKIDRPLRARIPLLANGKRVLWAIGVCIAEEAKLTPATKNAVRLTWNPIINRYGGNHHA